MSENRTRRGDGEDRSDPSDPDRDRAEQWIWNENALDQGEFEHFFSTVDGEPVGARGRRHETEIKAKDVKRVGGLVFAILIDDFRPAFAEGYVSYVRAVLPELELRIVSSDGDLHAVLRFHETTK